MSYTTEPLTADDIINILENASAFHQEWYDLAQETVIKLFSTYSSRNGLEVAFGWSLNNLSYSSKELISSRMYQLIDTSLRTLPVFATLNMANASARDVMTHFMEKMIIEIQLGSITLPQDIEAVLSVIYGQTGEKVNIAQACRDTGKTRHAVNTLMSRYTADAYRRYRAVRGGQRYAIVMGDCDGYIQDHPQFAPVQLLDAENGEAPRIEAGDLVAERGSSRWFTVSHLTTSNRLVFTDEREILHLPVRHLPRQYAMAAHRFCGSVNHLSAHEFVAKLAHNATA